MVPGGSMVNDLGKIGAAAGVEVDCGVGEIGVILK
jgi:hypothetical protein